MTGNGKWSVWKAALYGAGLGALIVLVRLYLLGETLPQDPAEATGYFAGSILGGALVFALIAVVRNVVVGSRKS